jgi:hypothetical protein
MLSMKRAAAIAPYVVIATVVGVNVSAADTALDLTLKNQFSVGVSVRIGDKDFEVGKGAEKKLGMRAAKGSSLKWTAKPAKDSDKSLFVSCEGSSTVSDKGAVVVDKASAKCTSDDRSAAAKAGAGDNPAPKAASGDSPPAKSGSADKAAPKDNPAAKAGSKDKAASNDSPAPKSASDSSPAPKKDAANPQADKKPPENRTVTLKFKNQSSLHVTYEVWDNLSPVNAHENGGLDPGKTFSYDVVQNVNGNTDVIFKVTCYPANRQSNDIGEYHRPPGDVSIQDGKDFCQLSPRKIDR